MDSEPGDPIDQVPPADRAKAPPHRQCPICFRGKLNGVGLAYHTAGRTRYYKCDRCGHAWKATITPPTLPPAPETRPLGGLSERPAE